MAIKGDRVIYEDRVDVFLNEAAAKGKIICKSTYGSGVALDDVTQLGTVAADPSGIVVLGVLMNDMVDIDVTRQFLNTQKDEVVKGSKVTLATKGWIVTDNLEQGTITAGEAAYVGQSGLFANEAAIEAVQGVVYGCAVSEDENAATFRKVGRFESSADQNGYVKVSIDIS